MNARCFVVLFAIMGLGPTQFTVSRRLRAQEAATAREQTPGARQIPPAILRQFDADQTASSTPRNKPSSAGRCNAGAERARAISQTPAIVGRRNDRFPRTDGLSRRELCPHETRNL